MNSKIFAGVLVFLIASLSAFAEENNSFPADTWYFAVIDGQQAGPYTVAELTDLYANGQIDKATLVWNEDMPGWTPISNVAALSSVIPNNQADMTGAFSDSDNTSNEYYIRAGLSEAETAYLYKKSLGGYVTNQKAMQVKFNNKLAAGIVLASLGGVFSTSGIVLLGVGLFYHSNSILYNTNIPLVSESEAQSAANATIVYGVCISLSIPFILAGIILGPLCAIPFSNAGKIASIYKKINKSKLFSALSRTSIGGGYDWENKHVNVTVAIKL